MTDDPKLLVEDQTIVKEPKERDASVYLTTGMRKTVDLTALRGLNPAQKRLVAQVNETAGSDHYYATGSEDYPIDCLSPAEIAAALAVYVAALGVGDGRELLANWWDIGEDIGAEDVGWGKLLDRDNRASLFRAAHGISGPHMTLGEMRAVAEEIAGHDLRNAVELLTRSESKHVAATVVLLATENESLGELGSYEEVSARLRDILGRLENSIQGAKATVRFLT
jgi:hypothetical protein